MRIKKRLSELSERGKRRLRTAGIITACTLALCIFLKESLGLFYFRMTHLTKEDMEWMDCVNNYPSPFFISNTGDTARLSYTDLCINDSANRFYVSLSPTYDFEANATYRFNVHFKDMTIEGALAVFHCVGTDSVCAKYFFGAASTSNRPQIIKPETYRINGRPIKDCLIVSPWEQGNVGISYLWDEKYDMKKFVISKEYGLIYYKLEDGEEFFRQFPSDSIQSRSS